MKKVYQKPEAWVETFVMDASIAANCDTPESIDTALMDSWNEAGGKDFMSLDKYAEIYNQSMGNASVCKHTPTAMFGATMS